MIDTAVFRLHRSQWYNLMPQLHQNFARLLINALFLQLTIKGEAYNIWFTVTHVDNRQFSQLQICVCPFFIVRNHLRWPVVMTATSRDEGHNRRLLSHGRGNETEVFFHGCIHLKAF